MNNAKLINLVINDQSISVPEGTTVLQACESLQVEVPVFCYHPRLAVAGNCRMCLVEVEKMPKPVASCAMPVSDGMVVRTQSAMVENARKGVLEFLLINHPLDCPVCDQGGECDLQDITYNYSRGCSRFDLNKRAVLEKHMGPLIKTMMNRCIHCTRCVRFSNEIAGVPEIGAIHRWEHTEITTLEKAVTSELSGNLIDICPVGALTSKPYAFHGRPWELTKTYSIDVLDGVGSNIRIDSKGNRVMRILPRTNDAINEEWISDKTRFAYDGLAQQRLDQPYHRVKGQLTPCHWDEAIVAARQVLSDAHGSEIAGLIGNQVDIESIFALRLLLDGIQSPYRDCSQNHAIYSTACRSHYTFNTTIEGIEESDFIVLCGTNPRHEAPLINARIRKRTLLAPTTVCLIGTPVDLTYPYIHISSLVTGLSELLKSNSELGARLANAKNPMFILGESCFNRIDTMAILQTVQKIMMTFPAFQQAMDEVVTWNGFNVLHHCAGRVGALDVGFVPASADFNARAIFNKCKTKEIKVVLCLGIDEIAGGDFSDAFVIYIGSHGDQGATRADLILPAPSFVEKNALYANTEGRVQETQQAVGAPGQARGEVDIILALFKALCLETPYESAQTLRELLYKTFPHLSAHNQITPQKFTPFECGESTPLSSIPFEVIISNFYMTCPISRHSVNMANCVNEILKNGGTAS